VLDVDVESVASVVVVAVLAATRRGRWLAALAVIVLAACAQGVLLSYSWAGIACLAPAAWTPALLDVLRPGGSADASMRLAPTQALSVLSAKDLGREVNLTARYVSSAKLIYVLSAAYTLPGEAIRDALNDDFRNWFSASALVIARF